MFLMVVSGNNRVDFFILSVSLKLFCTECACSQRSSRIPKLVKQVTFLSKYLDSRPVKRKLIRSRESLEFRKVDVLVRRTVEKLSWKSETQHQSTQFYGRHSTFINVVRLSSPQQGQFVDCVLTRTLPSSWHASVRWEFGFLCLFKKK